MVFQEPEIKDIALSLVKLIGKKVSVKKVILFGSYAWGRPTKYSDIDLAIISPAFRKMSDIRRIMFLLDAVRNIKTQQLVDIEPLGFTPEELEKADYFDIAAEIKERGKMLYP